MWRFMWNGVDHLGMGSKLLTQQEQDTLADGGMWRLHKGRVIGEASRCKSRSVSVCDMDVCECKQRKSMPGCTRRHQAHQDTFSLHVSVADAGQDAKGQFHGSFQKCKRLEGQGACISWMIGRQAA